MKPATRVRRRPRATRTVRRPSAETGTSTRSQARSVTTHRRHATRTVRPPNAGDGWVNLAAGEECDNGGDNTADCDVDCTFSDCGDGYVNEAAGEECDAAGETALCNGNCTLPECGDGYLNEASGETCDDRNHDGGDGCSPDCQVPERRSVGVSDGEIIPEDDDSLYTLWSGVFAGDVDGDGLDDILVGDIWDNVGRGTAYLFTGPLTGTVYVVDADATFTGPSGGDTRRVRWRARETSMGMVWTISSSAATISTAALWGSSWSTVDR